MHNPEIQTLSLRAIDYLQQTTRIRRGHNARAGRADVFDFALKEITRHFRLGKIVNPRAAAAPGAFGQIHKSYFWKTP